MSRDAFSDIVIDHFFNTRNVGPLPEANGEGWAGVPTSSRFMFIQVLLIDDRIIDARFGTYGCVPAIACGSCITEWAKGHSAQEALDYTPRQLRKALGGIPEGRRYCADLAVDALRAAVHDARKRQEEGKT